jgi:hypothetical protein
MAVGRLETYRGQTPETRTPIQGCLKPIRFVCLTFWIPTQNGHVWRYKDTLFFKQRTFFNDIFSDFFSK